MNSIASTTGALLMMAGILTTAAIIARFNGFYRRELANVSGRQLSLDGLRGMAALLVAGHHSGMYYVFLNTGDWGNAGSSVLLMFGPAGVLFFFMLTGHLFWDKARAAGGKFNILKLWRGRLFRIAPLYLFSVVVLLTLATIHTGTAWMTINNWKPLLKLMTLGSGEWSLIGSINLGNYNAGVVWTLWYEWRFYFVLPFIAWLAVGRRTLWLAIVAYAGVLIASLHFKMNLQPGLVFILGMLSPVLLDDTRLRSQLRHPLAGGCALLATIGLCALDGGGKPTFAMASSLFPLFLVVAAGNNLFGFLTHPAVRCLGFISYSLYLLHYSVFYATFTALKAIGLGGILVPAYWPIIVVSGMAATLLCSVTYQWIEYPFLSTRPRSRTAVCGQGSIVPEES